MRSVRMQRRETRTTKGAKECIVMRRAKEFQKRCGIVQGGSRQPINDKNRSEESVIPKRGREMRLSQKSQSHIHYMSMFMFSKTILLSSVRVRNTMLNTMERKKWLKLMRSVLSTTIGL
jgi:hypothetical protein